MVNDAVVSHNSVNELYYLEEVDSTNTWAKANLDKFGQVGAVYTTSQTAGRGRRGHTWINASGQALYYLSLIHISGQHNIQQGQVKVMLGNQVRRGAAIVGNRAVRPRAAQSDRNQLGNGNFVLHNQNAVHPMPPIVIYLKAIPHNSRLTA